MNAQSILDISGKMYSVCQQRVVRRKIGRKVLEFQMGYKTQEITSFEATCMFPLKILMKEWISVAESIEKYISCIVLHRL